MLARRASISRVCQTANVFHVCAKRRHFTAGHSLPGLPSPRLRGLIWAWFYAVTSISAIEKRFRNVAKGNISRLHDVQAFHAFAKRQTYFTFARSADISPPGTACPACPHPACAVRFWAWFYAVTSISAMTARFRNVAKGNISRLRDAQAFHAAVKRPPYFMFARSADISLPGTACPACPHPACAVYFGT